MDTKIKTMIEDKFELETRLDVELGTVTANTLNVVDGYTVTVKITNKANITPYPILSIICPIFTSCIVNSDIFYKLKA